MFKDDIAQELDTMQKEAMLLKGKGIDEMENKADRILGDNYWEKMFSQISKLYPDNKKSQIYKYIATVQMYAYSSTKFKTSKLSETLQSFKYTKKVLSYLYKHSDCLFLTIRHNEEWKAIFK